MPKFSATFQRTASTSLSVGSMTAAASSPRRALVYELDFGSEASPADNPFLWQVPRCTTAGTAGSTFTAIALNPADTLASTIVCGVAHTTDPTVTASTFLLSIPLNQRATYQWRANPGSELVIPATASNGLAIRTPTSSAVSVTATALYDEQ